MGEPILIRYLAEQMIRLSGKRVNQDICIDFVGLRPGEKLTEELFLEDERPMPTPHEKLLLARSVALNLGEIDELLEGMKAAVDGFDEALLHRQLLALVPEFIEV